MEQNRKLANQLLTKLFYGKTCPQLPVVDLSFNLAFTQMFK